MGQGPHGATHPRNARLCAPPPPQKGPLDLANPHARLCLRQRRRLVGKPFPQYYCLYADSPLLAYDPSRVQYPHIPCKPPLKPQQALKSHVDTIRGIDIAPGMATQYNARALEAGIPSAAMHAHHGDILAPTPTLTTPDLYNFDLAVTSMALHHFPDPEAVLTALVARLKPGGTVAVLDWAPGGDEMPWGKGEHEAARTINTDAGRILEWGSVLPMLGRAGCELSTAYYAVVGEKSHLPEEATKVPGGVDMNGFIAFAKKAE